MAMLKIRIYGDPILRKKATLVEKIGLEEKKMFEDMAQTMYASKGVGLAATQVGFDKQLIVVDTGSGLLKLANPKVIKAQCSRMGEEGCLSFPDITVKIKRPEKISVEALNHDGIKVQIEAENLLARAIQHEMDHLKGIVIIDKIGMLKKAALAGKLNQLKKISKEKNRL